VRGRIAKRGLDVIGAAAGLLLLSPVLVAIAATIKFESTGPVFFRQRRVGLNGKEFSILKFRTMRQGAERDGALVTTRGDSRITRCGVFLRKYKLDELPQLLNVLGGSMSLVGPRPEVPHYLNLYPAEQRAVITSVKPGMTDYAAIELRDEEAVLASYPDPQRAYVDALMPRKFALYKKYVDDQSLALDLKLIWRTISAIVGGGRPAT
jgi:lipopolysaccharide/colanic/teichoic acid biosynthesis glycosyltransferase